MCPPTGHLCLVSDELLEQKAPTLHAILEHLAEAPAGWELFLLKKCRNRRPKGSWARLEMSVSIQFFLGARHGGCNFMQYWPKQVSWSPQSKLKKTLMTHDAWQLARTN